jgi:uncharacterized membrane protein
MPSSPESVAPAPLITDPLSIFVFLLGLVGFVFFLGDRKSLSRFFDVVPPLVFCYFLPMIATTCGVIPQESDLYKWINRIFLPPILLLLLVSADLKAILHLGPKALAIMLAGTVGIVAGSILGYTLFRSHLGEVGWLNIGALSASWIGGSANMAAVLGALAADVPKEQNAPIFIVDPVCSYTWMGILIYFSAWQARYTAAFKIDDRAVRQMNDRLAAFSEQSAKPMTTSAVLVILAFALGGGYLSILFGEWLGNVIKASTDTASPLRTFSGATITVIAVSILGIVLSFTPLRRLEQSGASKMGYVFLYLLLPTFGAQANLRDIGNTPWYIACGIVMIAVHAGCIFLTMWLLKAPLFFGATASQANIGGPASASVVASSYQSSLAPVGVLMGILGGILGTYTGLLTAYICRWISGA